MEGVASRALKHNDATRVFISLIKKYIFGPFDPASLASEVVLNARK